MSDVHAQALDNLVNQFARPLDFLRELAQNSIDAGSPRIEVWVDYLPPRDDAQGVLQIGVDDFGEGMDEAIIDDKLSRLFESTKDDDLTKIGKFGIGFTSIFAIAPDAVVLLTGRHGSWWKLHFHRDRTFSKLAYDEPVQGTKITLYKELPADQVEGFVRDARDNLAYWCEHSDCPITFHDRTQGEQAPVTDTADPFAAFADDVQHLGPQPINRPLDLDADLFVRHTEPGTEVVIGYEASPRFGYYNGGLTLLNTPHVDALGVFSEALGHLSFKVKNDRLEHTLTRDNVLQDDHWRQAMNVVIRARAQLRKALVDRVEAAVRDGHELPRWHRHLAEECASATGDDLARSLRKRTLFRDPWGRPLTAERVRAQRAQVGAVVLGEGDTQLHAMLDKQGIAIVADAPATRGLLQSMESPPLFEFLRVRHVYARADELFVLPDLVDPSALSAEERSLLERTRELMAAAVGLRLRVPATEAVFRYAPDPDGLLNRIELVVGDFGGMQLGSADVLALNGPRDKTVFARPGPRWLRLPGFLSWRSLLVNRHHPLFRAQVLASHEDLHLAAVGLAMALLHSEGLEGEASYLRLLEAAWAERGVA